MAVDVSIIILNYNTKKMTSECIESVYKYTRKINFELFLIDNASTDGSQKYLERFRKNDNFKLILNSKNVGFGVGNNQGIKLSKGKYILLLNSDTLLHEDSISKVVNFMSERPKSGIASCNLVGVDQTNQPNGGYFPTLIRVFAWMTFLDDITILNKIIKPFHPKPFRVGVPVELDWVMGSFFLIKNEVIRAVGVFDKDYFMYTEEVDYCYRARQNGWKVWFVPNTSILHYGGASSSSEFAITNEFRGITTFYSKHFNMVSQWLLRLILFIGIMLRIIIYSIMSSDKAKIYQKSLHYI